MQDVEFETASLFGQDKRETIEIRGSDLFSSRVVLSIDGEGAFLTRADAQRVVDALTEYIKGE